MKMLEEIYIWWEGAFNYSDILNNKIDSTEYDNKATDIGLYTVYGYHPLYGKDVLLYIGITTKQSFQQRLKNRWIISESSDIENIKIYLGKIYNPSKTVSKQIEKESIKKAEALLINILKPAFNSSYINSVNHENLTNGNKFIIFNKNSYRDLPPEISTMRWWHSKQLNFNIVEEIAKIRNMKIEDSDFYGFFLDDKENIYFGVDYDYWDKENIPLVIGIYKKTIKQNILKKNFPNVNKDGAYSFISMGSDLKDNNIIDKIINQIENIENLLK